MIIDHIWYMPFEEERDRPNPGYIKGNKLSLAIDAGGNETVTVLNNSQHFRSEN